MARLFLALLTLPFSLNARNQRGYGLVGNTYNVNVFGLFKTGENQSLRALSSSLMNEAKAVGASRISISGNSIVNEDFSGMNPAAAQRFGFQLQKISSDSITLTAPVP